MTTSGVTSFNVTRNEIIELALEDIKVFAPDFETLLPAVYVRANKRLNMMIKAWQASGVGLWLNSFVSITTIVGEDGYYLGPLSAAPMARPIDVVECRYVDSSGSETEMTKISRQEYVNLSLKTSQGVPSLFYYDPQITNGVLYVWQTASVVTSTLKMTVRTPVQDFVNTTDNPHFPVEWADALHYNLAARLAPVFGVPASIAASVKELAVITLRDADDFDREQGVSVQFVPEVEL